MLSNFLFRARKMGNLKDSIVVKNQFTNNKSAGFGKTLDKYIMRYVSRKGATEALTPIVHNDFSADDYVGRYMTRRSATDALIANGAGPEELTYRIGEMQGYDGVAFGSLGVSYDDETLQAESEHMQDLFDDGHTVLKTVLSFRTDYLKSVGILPEDFKLTNNQGFRGQVDQLKMRSAINDAMARTTSMAGFSEPVWVGTIQLDTNHVHAHLVTSEDASRADMTSTGEERGKLRVKEMQLLRTSFDNSVREASPLLSYNQEIAQTRQAVARDVASLISRDYETSSKLQYLMASLPDNVKEWRYKSEAADMQRPKELMHDYYNSLQTYPELAVAFDQAHQNIDNYAATRVRERGGSYKDYVDTGESLLEERISNQVFRHLGRMSTKHDTHTDYVDSVVDSDVPVVKIEPMMPNVELALFQQRLDMYCKRLRRRQKNEKTYRDAETSYYDLEDAGKTTDESQAMLEYYQTMGDYNAQLVDKYLYMLGPDNTVPRQMRQQQRSLTSEYHYLASVRDYGGYVKDFDVDEANLHNEALAPASQETLQSLTQHLGVSELAYQQLHDDLEADGAQKLGSFESVSDLQYENSRKLYTDRLLAFNRSARDKGLVTRHAMLYDDGSLQAPESLNVINELTTNDFNDVAGLDLSDLGYDFDVHESRTVGSRMKTAFSNWVDKRRKSIDKARSYLVGTQQSDNVLSDAETELQRDEKTALYVAVSNELPRYESDRTVDSLVVHPTISLDKARESFKSSIRDVSSEVMEVQNSLSRDVDIIPETEDVPDSLTNAETLPEDMDKIL